MKSIITTRSLIITIFMVLCGATHGQCVLAKSYLEQTHVSPKVGTAVGYEFADRIEAGGFFQRSAASFGVENGAPLRMEHEFYGAYFAYPVLVAQQVIVKFNVRTGISNGENFVITPGLTASYFPVTMWSVGGGIGVRSFRPTGMVTISFRLSGDGRWGYYR